METSAVKELGATTLSPTTESAGRAALGQQEFLRMLIAQLENQDPLNPQDATEFTAQLAQFSSLEQLLSIRSGLDKLASAESASRVLAASNLIGRDVMARGSQLTLSAGAAPRLSFELEGASSSTRIRIVDARGNLVRTLDLGPRAQGRHAVSWDGLGEGGSTLPPGTYSFEIDALAGSTPVAASRFVEGRVTGSVLRGETPVLMLGDVPIPLGDVEEVREPGSGA